MKYLDCYYKGIIRHRLHANQGDNALLIYVVQLATSTIRLGWAVIQSGQGVACCQIMLYTRTSQPRGCHPTVGF